MKRAPTHGSPASENPCSTLLRTLFNFDGELCPHLVFGVWQGGAWPGECARKSGQAEVVAVAFVQAMDPLMISEVVKDLSSRLEELGFASVTCATCHHRHFDPGRC